MHSLATPVVSPYWLTWRSRKVQFISRRPDYVRVHYTAGHNADDAVQKAFQQILDMKGASRTSFEVQRVQDIPTDAKTGKLRLVKIE